MKVIIEADGGSRGNPGPAGSGSVVLDEQRNELAAIPYVVGKATNNVAEYHGLLNGLTKAKELGATDVVVRMDSKLVVEQMSGRWKIKHPDMQELALQCRAIAQEFASITYNWVPRKENKRADELANIAMDALAKGAKVGAVELPGQSEGKVDSEAESAAAESDSNTAENHKRKGKGEGDEKGEAAASSSSEQSTDSGKSGPASWNGANCAPLRLILLRHGQTEMSAKRLYSGRSNPPLSEIGEQQAKAAARFIAGRGGIDAVVASPLERCQQTARYAADALGLEVETIEGLVELDFGEWDGLSFNEASERDPELHAKWLQDPKVAPPGGESLQASFRRVKAVHAELEQRFAGKNVLVVSHVTPIKSLLRLALGATGAVYHRMHLDLASISIVEFYADGPTCVRSMNDTGHLR